MQQKVIAKNIDLNKINMSQDKLLKLLELQASVGWAALHELNNSTSKIMNWAYIAKKLVEDSFESKISDEELKKILDYMNDIENETLNLIKFNRSIFASAYDSQFGNLVSKPQILIEEIVPIFSNAKISLGNETWKTLEFVYPEKVLEIIIRECFTNAIKHNTKNNCDIITVWSIKENSFSFEIHDNGAGIIQELSPELFPFSFVFDKLREKNMRVGGLKIINKIIRNSDGNLFVSKSQKLGGTMLAFTLPTFAYYNDGHTYEIN